MMKRLPFRSPVVPFVALLAILATAVPASAAIVDGESDLHLDPAKVISAVNFGGVGQAVNGVQFYGAVGGATVDGVANNGNGAYFLGKTGWRPEVADLLGSNLYGDVGGGYGYDVTIPVDDGRYQLQLLMYEGWVTGSGIRVTDVTLEGALIADDFDFAAAQGGTYDHGTIITSVFDVTDQQVDVNLSAIAASPHLNGLVLNDVAEDATLGTTITPFDDEADLDNVNVVKALNFGSKYTPAPVVNGVAFTYSANNATVDGVTNTAPNLIIEGRISSDPRAPNGSPGFTGIRLTYGFTTFVNVNNSCGTYPQKVDVEGIFGGLIFSNVAPKVLEIDVDVSGEDAGWFEVQLVMYEGWGDATTNRQCDVTMEGTLVEDDYTYYTEQGSGFLDGSVITQMVYCDDGNIDIDVAAVSFDALVSAIVVSVPEPSTIVMLLASGLLGLALYGWRRRSSVG